MLDNNVIVFDILRKIFLVLFFMDWFNFCILIFIKYVVFLFLNVNFIFFFIFCILNDDIFE